MTIPLQTPGGIELLVIALAVLIPLVVLGAVVYLLYRIANQSKRTETGAEIKSEDRAEDVDGQTQPFPIRRLVDWVVAFSLFLAGILSILIGSTLSLLADRGRIERLIEDDVIQSDVLSEAALGDVAYIFMLWGGAGIIVAGILAVLAGVVFAAARLRRESQSGRAGEPAPSLVANALLGAVVTVVISFVPFSAILGGGAAGYLQQRGPRVGLQAGVLAGLFVSVPLLTFLGAVTLGLLSAGMVVFAMIVLIGLLFSLIYSVGLSAIGGYAGGYLAGR